MSAFSDPLHQEYRLFDPSRQAFGTRAEGVVDAPIADVWNVLRQFGEWQTWFSDAYKNLIPHRNGGKSDVVGSAREFNCSQGRIKEQLLKLDEEQHRVVYGYIEGPSQYLAACITSVAIDMVTENSCQIYWSTIFQPAIPENAEKLSEIQEDQFAVATSHLQKHFYYNFFDPTRRAFGTTVEGVVDVPIEQAWNVLRDFSKWDQWWPTTYGNLVLETEGDKADAVGCVRAFDRVQGRFREELLKLDEEHHRVVYGYIEGPVDYLTACITTVAVDKKSENSCQLYWSSIFQPAHPRQAESLIAIMENEFKEATLYLGSRFYYNHFEPSRRAFGTTFEGTVDAPIDGVWTILRDFANWDKWWPTMYANLEFLPAAEDTNGIGCVRGFDRIQGRFQEKLLKLDEENRRVVFGYVDGPPGFISACITTVAVDKIKGDSTLLYWSSILQPVRIGQSGRICAIQESEFEDGTLHLRAFLESGWNVVTVQLTDGYMPSGRRIAADYVLVTTGDAGVHSIALNSNGTPKMHEPVTFRVKSLDAQLQFIVMDTRRRKDRSLGVGWISLSECDEGQEIALDMKQDGQRLGTLKARLYISPAFKHGKK